MQLHNFIPVPIENIAELFLFVSIMTFKVTFERVERLRTAGSEARLVSLTKTVESGGITSFALGLSGGKQLT